MMGCSVGNNQLLLIYEYIGTNSLEDALFGSDELRARLDWATRYRICLGLAEGLSFLHEGSKQETIKRAARCSKATAMRGVRGRAPPQGCIVRSLTFHFCQRLEPGGHMTTTLPVTPRLPFKQETIHGDIKPANIILDADLNQKIYDFGFGKALSQAKARRNNVIHRARS